MTNEEAIQIIQGMELNEFDNPVLCEEAISMAIDALKSTIRTYGNYALYDVNATHEDMEKAVMEDAAKLLVELSALKIVINDIPDLYEDGDKKAKVYKTGGWTINLPTREGGTI